MKDDGGLDQDSKQEKVKRGQVLDMFQTLCGHELLMNCIWGIKVK